MVPRSCTRRRRAEPCRVGTPVIRVVKLIRDLRPPLSPRAAGDRVLATTGHLCCGASTRSQKPLSSGTDRGGGAESMRVGMEVCGGAADRGAARRRSWVTRSAPPNRGESTANAGMTLLPRGLLALSPRPRAGTMGALDRQGPTSCWASAASRRKTSCSPGSRLDGEARSPVGAQRAGRRRSPRRSWSDSLLLAYGPR